MLPQRHSIRSIHPQHLERDSPHCGPSDNRATCGFEMVTPTIGPRMKKPHQFSGFAIPAGYIRPFVSIAGRTGERQISLLRLAAMLLGDDVIDLKRKRQNELGKAAVFTPMLGPLPHSPSEVAIHGFREEGCCRNWRAFDCRIASCVPMCR